VVVFTSTRADTMSALRTPTVSGNQGTIPHFVAECQDLGNARCEYVGVLSTFLDIQDGE